MRRPKPKDVPAWRWWLIGAWRRLQWRLGLHWKQRRQRLTLDLLQRRIRSVQFGRRWDRILRKDPCVYCGSRTLMTVEHVLPLSRGGRDAAHNKVGACLPCNSGRGNMPLLQWLLLCRSHRSPSLPTPAAKLPAQITREREVRAALRNAQRLASVGEAARWRYIVAEDARRRRPSDVDLRKRT